MIIITIISSDYLSLVGRITNRVSERRAFLDHSWKYFEALNRSIADVIIKDYKKGDTVWVNDYHLLLVPRMVRDALGPDAKIGFFLHVGFPSSEIFRCLAHREKLLMGILGATLVGFQTEEYARHFLQTCSRLLNVEVKNDGVLLDSRLVDVISLPIGIDPGQLEEKRKEPEVDEWMAQLKQRYAGMKLFVARDKVGLPPSPSNRHIFSDKMIVGRCSRRETEVVGIRTLPEEESRICREGTADACISSRARMQLSDRIF